MVEFRGATNEIVYSENITDGAVQTKFCENEKVSKIKSMWMRAISNDSFQILGDRTFSIVVSTAGVNVTC